MKKNFYGRCVDTADKHSFAKISVNFRKNLKWSLWDTHYSGARGTLIHENNLKLKISCQTPFKGCSIPLHHNISIVLAIFFMEM